MLFSSHSLSRVSIQKHMNKFQMSLGKVSLHKLHLYLWISDCIIATIVLPPPFFFLSPLDEVIKKEKKKGCDDFQG